MARVEKNAAAGQYEMQVDGETALVQYRDEGPGTVRLIHTEVPQALEGRGIGSSLARGVLEAVRAEGRTVVPQCAFIANYIGRHPEYQDLVASTVRDQSLQWAPSLAMNFSDPDEDRSLGRGTGGTGGTTRGIPCLKGNRLVEQGEPTPDRVDSCSPCSPFRFHLNPSFSLRVPLIPLVPPQEQGTDGKT
jgi:predicted GNAT family acetyltransferase